MWMRRLTNKGWGKWHPFENGEGQAAWSLCGRVHHQGWDRDLFQFSKVKPTWGLCQNHNCGGRVPRTTEMAR